MSTLSDLLAEHTSLSPAHVDHLQMVVAEWQLLADLSFADYLMWVSRDDGVLVCVAQVRPNTAPTVLLESMKMEIPVLAEVAGTVSKVSVSVGDVIQAGDLIAVIS